MTTSVFDPADPRACKQVIAAALAEHGLSNRLTAKTIDFEDLARASMVFVTIHGWGSPAQQAKIGALLPALEVSARAHGFRVQVR